MTVRSYGPDTDFGYVLTLNLTIADMTLLMVMTYPRFMGNYCVKYYPDPTWQYGVIPGHGICLCVHGDLYLGNKTIG